MRGTAPPDNTAIPPPRGRLLRKYALTMSALIAAALMASGAVQVWFSAVEHEDSLVRLQRKNATAAAAAIEQFVAGIEGQLGWTTHASIYAGPDGSEQRRLDFIRLLRQVPPITEVAYIDANGEEQLRISRIALDVVGSGVDRSDEPAFAGAKVNSNWRGPIYFRKESEPYMTIAAAARGRSGVTVAEVNLKFIWDVISEIEVGRTGRAYVVDEAGRLIAHPDIGLVLRRADLSDLPQVAAALDAEPADAHMVAPDPEGREALSAYARIDTLGWLVFVDLPVDEAYEPLYASILRIGGLLLGGVPLAALAGLMLARRMTGPIRRMQATAAHIGGGHLADRIDIRTGDELEALADEFNRMARRLHDSHASLERKVEERTRQLQQKTGEVEALSAKLAKYLSPQVYASIFAGRQQVELASQRKKLTVCFSDIEGFTETADAMESEDLTQLLNQYLSEMSRVALEHGGTIDKYVGDAIMIFFGDPESRGVREDAFACVKMAIAMQQRMQELSASWRNAGIERPLACRIGIHTGYCTVGNFGSEDRMDYTIIGGTVNLASRLEHEAPAGGILISYETWAHVKAEVRCEEMGRIQVRGIGHPVAAWRVVDLHANLSEARRPLYAELPHFELRADPEQMTDDERERAAAILDAALARLRGDPGRPPSSKEVTPRQRN